MAIIILIRLFAGDGGKFGELLYFRGMFLVRNKRCFLISIVTHKNIGIYKQTLNLFHILPHQTKYSLFSWSNVLKMYFNIWKGLSLSEITENLGIRG